MKVWTLRIIILALFCWAIGPWGLAWGIAFLLIDEGVRVDL